MQDSQDQDMYTVTTVTDDDGDHHGETTTTATAEQDRLRIAAEKRRQKILHQANTRMSIVDGTYNSNSSTTAATTTTTEEAIAAVTTSESVVEDTTIATKVGTSGTNETPAETIVDTSATDSATTTSSTTSSKLAAMRRRRFQKKVATPLTPSTAADIIPDATVTTNETLKSSTEPTTSTDHAVVAVAESTKVHDDDNNGAVVMDEMTTTTATATTTVTSSTPPENVTASELEPKDDMTMENATTTKKYLGVAKMRRRMIKERQEQQQQSQLDEGDDSQMKSDRKSNVPTSSTTSNKVTTGTSNIVLPKKHRPMITTLPILMYAVTTLLLFVTGLHIGLQQTQIHYCYNTAAAEEDGYCYNTSKDTPQWSVVVHSELAPRKMGGLQRLLSVMNIVGVPATTTSTGINNDKLMNEEFVVVEPSSDNAEDEFATTEPTVKTMSKDRNIDPLFQVDLDALTTGDGLYFTLGRFAVRMHRFILTVLFYTPTSILQSIVSFFWSFIQTPPILFIVAIFIRHGLGKVVLGAKLPSPVADETQHKDILSTVKTFVMKFLLSSFPTITIVYDVWTYIRSDMYVMLCGLFVGIALSHHHQAGSPYGETTNPISTTFTTNTPMDGSADEL